MNKVGKIIRALNKPFAKIKDHNARVEAREKRIRSIVTEVRAWSYMALPLALTVGLATWGHHGCAQEEKKVNTAIEHVAVGNYNTAKGQFVEIEEAQGVGELESIIVGIDQRELDPTRAEMYRMFHGGTDDLGLHQFKFDNKSTTSLETITASDGKEFYAIADGNELFFFNEDTLVRMGLNKLQGWMIPKKERLIVGAWDGLIYEITLTKDHENYMPTAKTLFDAGLDISRLRQSKQGYFFTTESGDTIGIDERGEIIFTTNAQKETPKPLLPPTLADVDGVPGEEIIYYHDGLLRIDTMDNNAEFRTLLEGTPINEILVGDVDGDTKKDILAMTDENTYLLLSEKSWTPQLIDVPANKFPSYRWALADVDSDGTDDLLYAGRSFMIFEGSKKEPFSTRWDFPEGVYYFQNSLNEAHHIIGAGEDTLFITKPFRKPLFQFRLDQQFSSDRILHGTLNGKRYLTFVTDKKAFMIGEGWLEPLPSVCQPGGYL